MKKAFLSGTAIDVLLTFALLMSASEHAAFAQRFQAPSALTVGANASQVFAGDFNKDGIPDLLVIDGSAPALQVLFGNGDGTFQAPVKTTVAGSTVAVGDFNGDGIPDVAVGASNGNTGTLTIFLGNKDGTFTATAQGPLANPHPIQRITAVTLNQTGSLGLVVFNQTSNSVDVFTGKGDGTFTFASTQSFSSGAVEVIFGVVVGDFDGDGNADMVVSFSDAFPDSLKVLKGNGDGTFQPPVTATINLAGALIPGRLAAVDFDGDGKLDLILEGFAGLVLFPGNGDLTFQAPVVLGSGFFDGDIAIADMNGDGHPDIVASTGPVHVLLNDGHGKIASSRSYSSLAGSLAVADFNGDGHPDIVAAAGAAPNNVQVILNNGDGTMHAGFSLDFSGKAVVADFNNDGQPDIAFPGFSVGVLVNSGNFQFAVRQPVLSENDLGSPSDAVNGDFNGDGHQDLVLIGSTRPRTGPVGKMKVVLGNGDGTLKDVPVEPSPLPAPAPLHKIAAGDFNEDGKLDVVATNMDTNSTTVGLFLGNGDGTFQAPSVVTAGSLLTGIVVGDFSGHGHLDIAVTNKGDGTNPSTVSILLGNGDGTFTLGTPVTVGVAPVALAAGDLNGDGKLDLVVANSGNGKPGSVSILIGNGDGTFQPAVSLPVTSPVLTLTLGDFNGDGFPDIAVAEHGSMVDLFTNKGDGTFPQVPEQYPTGGDASNLFAVDLNQGGIPDLVLSTFPLSVLPNRGGARISLTSSQNPSGAGQAVTFSANVNPNVPAVPAPTGMVQFSDGASVLATVPLSAGGTAAFTTSALTGGNHTIKASYSGDANFPARTFPILSQAIRAVTSLQVTSSANPSVFGSPVTISVAVTSATAGTPSGNVSLLDGTTVIASTKLDGSANASFALSNLAGGTHSLTVNYAGDQTFLASASNPVLSQVVNPAGTSSSLSSNSNPSTFGSPVTFSVHVTGVNSVAPTGTVSLLDGSTTLTSTPLDASGNATFNLGSLGGGTHNLTASYPGDQNYTASVSSSLSQVINQAASASSISSPFNPSTYSAGFSIVVKVSGPAPVAPSGTVTLLDGSAPLASAVLDVSGNVTFSLPSFATIGAGTHNLTASYAGDPNFTASVSPVLQQVVNKASSLISAVVSPNPAIMTPVSVFVAVSPTIGGVPGMVSLLDGATVIASGNADPDGFFRFTLSTLALGSHAISASYPGDANRTAVTSTVTNLNVFPVDFSVSASATAATVNAGQSASATLTFFSNPSFTSPVTFNCSGLPSLAACSFNPPTINPNATFQSTVLTITTTGPSLSASSGRSQKLPFYAVAVMFPGLAGLLLLGRNRRTALRGTLFCLLLFSLALLSSCGGNMAPKPPAPQTPDGTSTVVVTANGGVAHQVTFTLTVKN